ncbi:MAG: phosphoenolpyruvate synthase [Pseudobacter sp.]|uniref:phosphoenolpyruvate synthase n=1 Tax=Pseudobacter sp. TaxID=2045420 RepID=UPI003F7FFF7F
MNSQHSYTLDFRDIGTESLALAGGKAMNLAILSRIDGIQVPSGFCITTEAYRTCIETDTSIQKMIDQLSVLNVEETDSIKVLSAEIRNAISGIPIPAVISREISNRLSNTDPTTTYAVRSSATAEDLPTASFAGQQDTYLNISGANSMLEHISKCWASLFTERAVIYRIRHNIDHRQVRLAVIIQEMLFPQVSGILFTADPVSSNRKVISIDASFGLGEAMVSGLVNADNYKIENGKITEKNISLKQLVISPASNGSTEKESVPAVQQNKQALTDEQILTLAILARKIEAFFHTPQDIEWCLVNGKFHFVQSRPITTLFPIPETTDQEKHVFISVGHQQMMTNAIKPLGISIWQLTSSRPMYTAGGRLFIDITNDLSSPDKKYVLLNVLGKSDPLFKDAISSIMQREEFTGREQPGNKENQAPQGTSTPDYQTIKDFDAGIVTAMISNSQKEIEELRQNIQSKSGLELLVFIQEHLKLITRTAFAPQSFDVIFTAVNAAFRINENIQEWLGEKNVADKISQSVPNNITSEMGLELMDLADEIRPYPAIIDFLQQTKDGNFLDELSRFEGGSKIQQVFKNFLHKYGMRCAGEIDITQTRWSENPALLIPTILTNLKNFTPGTSKRKFNQGLQEAVNKENEIIERLKQLPDGDQKAAETKHLIRLVRDLSGYREYPKYAIVSRYFIYKQALLKLAAELVQNGTLPEKEDIYYLNFEELKEIVRTGKINHQLIQKRKEDFRFFEKLTPPRVLTSDGETFSGKYNRNDLPPGALPGIAVSSGIIEGRARVIKKMEEAILESDDILVTRFTDPSWTPLFVAIKGLVTEVGGLMTHGSVIAREYGLPAVVGVNNATRLIKNGQRIRVNGSDGYVEILSDNAFPENQ